MPIEHTSSGAMVVTGDSTNAFRLLVAVQGLEIHIKTNGRMRLTRIATPKRCMEVVSEFTGRKYKRTDAMIAAKDGRTVLEMGKLMSAS